MFGGQADLKGTAVKITISFIDQGAKNSDFKFLPMLQTSHRFHINSQKDRNRSTTGTRKLKTVKNKHGPAI